MTIKLLNKDLTSFLSEPFAENILPALKYNKKIKRLVKKGVVTTERSAKAILTLSETKPNDASLHFIKGREGLSDKMGKAEAQIVKQVSMNKINQFSERSSEKFCSSKLLGSVDLTLEHPKCTLTTDQYTAYPRSAKIKEDSFVLSNTKIREKMHLGISTSTTLPRLQDNEELRFLPLTPSGGLGDERNTTLPDLLFSLHQIRNECYQQARLTSSKRIQNKSYSEFKNQLRECKKVRLLYGHLSKRELEKSARKVKNLQVNENLLVYLETRLDVTLKRCGFFQSIRAARQFVIHGRIQINCQIIKIPSYQLKSGDIIKVKLKKDCKINTFSNTIPQTNKSQKGKVFERGRVIGAKHQAFCPPGRSITHEKLFNTISGGVSTQTHRYVQSVLSRLDSSRVKQKISLLGLTQGGAKRSVLDTDSAILPYLNQWRFIVPLYVLLSFLHAESLFHSTWSQNSWAKGGEAPILPNIPVLPTGSKAYVSPVRSRAKYSYRPTAGKRSIDSVQSLDRQYAQSSIHSQKSFLGASLREASFFYLVSYWLEMKKRCLCSRHSFWRQARFFPLLHDKNMHPFFSTEKKEKVKKSSFPFPDPGRGFEGVIGERPFLQTNYFQRQSKALHLEISYQSLCAIFLYPPQQIYLPAMIDLNLILKSVVISR